jgi:hypothetical protein
MFGYYEKAPLKGLLIRGYFTLKGTDAATNREAIFAVAVHINEHNHKAPAIHQMKPLACFTRVKS